MERTRHFLPAPWVHMIRTEDGGAVLLDLRQDCYLGFDPLATLMWELLVAGKTPREMVHHIKAEYQEIPDEQIQGDLAHFLHSLQVQHLLVSTDTEEALTKPGDRRYASLLNCLDWPGLLLTLIQRSRFRNSHLNWLEAWANLNCIQGWLQRQGLAHVCQLLSAIPADRHIPAPDPELHHIEAVVRSTALWMLFEAKCLQCSLALAFMLRRRGIRADLVLGVSKFPFEPHAWLKSGPDPLAHAITWEAGLGLDKRSHQIERRVVILAMGETLSQGKVR